MLLIRLVSCMFSVAVFVGTVLAYGQTSSGKTFTMRGMDHGSEMGVIPLSIENIYSRIESVCITFASVVSYYLHQL